LIYVFDFESKDRIHLPFNAAFLQVIVAAHPDRQVVFWADRTHIAAQKEEMTSISSNIILRTLPKSATLVSRDKFGSLRNFGALNCLKQSDLPSNSVILGADGWFIKQLSLHQALHKISSFDIVLHATISALGHKTSFLSRVFKRDLFTILQLYYPPQIRFVLLEQAIERNFRKHIRSTTRTASLEHPVEAGGTIDTCKPVPSRLQVAFIGGATKAKGFTFFCRAASHNRRHVDYHCIGSAPSNHDHTTDHLFATPPQSTMLSQREFEARVRSMDLVCLPLDPVYYSWAASGTLMDCIRFGISPIVLRNDVISDLEERYGQFGYIFDSPDQLVDFLVKIDRTIFERDRKIFTERLRKLRNDRSISAVANYFRLNGSK